MKRKIFSVLIALVLVLSFSLIPAMPAAAASTTWYVDDTATGTNEGTSLANAFLTIQEGINAASATDNDTISVAAGTYTEDISIPVSITGGLVLAGAGAGTTKIKGVSVALGAVVVTILANDVALSGFTIETSDSAVGADDTINGVWLAAVDAEIYNNTFKAACAGTGWVTLLTTHSGVGVAAVYGASTADVGGANIHDNTFTSNTTAVWSEGIYVNHNLDGAVADLTTIVTIQDNTFSGNLFRAITTERSYTTIDENTIASAYSASVSAAATNALRGIEVRSTAANQNADQDYVVVTNNTITGFGWGISLGTDEGSGGTLTTPITVESNTIATCVIGVKVRNDADVPTVNYNSITGSTTYGVENLDTVSLDAQYNWWGTAAGAYHATTNPGVAGKRGDTVSSYVTYAPWLFYTTSANSGDTLANIIANEVPAYANSVVLSSGWNTFSVPIGLDGQYNTWAELYTLTSANYSLAYRFNPTTQEFETLATTDTDAVAPGESFYIKMNEAGSLPYCYSTVMTIPSRALGDGWNFIGGGMTTQDEIVTCVSIATVGSTAGYTQIISPAENAASWIWTTGLSTQGDFVLGEGYWVFLPIDRTLGLFDLTPVTWVP